MNSSPDGDVAAMDASLESDAPSAPAVIGRSERSHDDDDGHGCREVAGSGSGGMISPLAHTHVIPSGTCRFERAATAEQVLRTAAGHAPGRSSSA
jgi:hypothetical protein